jgi:hypothetical protein
MASEFSADYEAMTTGGETVNRRGGEFFARIASFGVRRSATGPIRRGEPDGVFNISTL